MSWPGTAASSTRSPARRPQRRRRTAGIARQARAGTVTMPRGSRRATTTPCSAVRVSRSPSRQPSAQVTARSATRPEASIRPVPYTTPAGTDRAAAGPARGSGRTAAGLARGVPARRPGEGMTGAIGWAVTAASRNRAQHQPMGGGRPACSSGPPRVQAVSVLGTSHRFWCPRGDLNPLRPGVQPERFRVIHARARAGVAADCLRSQAKVRDATRRHPSNPDITRTTNLSLFCSI